MGGCEGQKIKETRIFAYYVQIEIFVRASVTREEGIRSLNHSDNIDMAVRLNVMLLI
jgi:hypothetical protein